MIQYNRKRRHKGKKKVHPKKEPSLVLIMFPFSLKENNKNLIVCYFVCYMTKKKEKTNTRGRC
jgi:hypothetical protein